MPAVCAPAALGPGPANGNDRCGLRGRVRIPISMAFSAGEQNMASLEEIDDRVAAAAFRRLVEHLRQRADAQNVDLMGLAGFCRTCIAAWLRPASAAHDRRAAADASRRALESGRAAAG